MIWPMVWTYMKMSPKKNTKNTQPPQSSQPQTSTNITSDDIYRLLII